MPRSRTPDEDRLLSTLHEEQRQVALRFRPLTISVSAGFALLFAWLQIWPLTLTYLASALFYGWLLYNSGRPGYQPTSLTALWLWLTVLTESLIAVAMLGPAPGFHFYLLGTIPASFSSLTRPMRYKVFQVCVIVTVFFLCDAWWLGGANPPYPLSVEMAHALRAFNGLGVCTILAWAAHARALAIHDAEASLRHIASTDSLTGLLNRRALSELFEREATRAARTHRPLSVILCDIDHFKRINDTHGHSAGDYVLETLGNLLPGALRQYDIVARWGGEEFLALLPDTDTHTALRVAERLRAAVAACTVQFEGQPIPLSLTVGCSQLHAGENWHAAVSRADAALYRGKDAGRNRVEAG